MACASRVSRPEESRESGFAGPHGRTDEGRPRSGGGGFRTGFLEEAGVGVLRMSGPVLGAAGEGAAGAKPRGRERPRAVWNTETFVP